MHEYIFTHDVLNVIVYIENDLKRQTVKVVKQGRGQKAYSLNFTHFCVNYIKIRLIQ